ncbi:hypothetical protein [Nocardia alni]|uniref:hypothetical protein n=1 Tax=Nocardia alni TaxID=2815723 RepID=UPI0020B399CA|nr:hypothetical protein [Nocardia alni]
MSEGQFADLVAQEMYRAPGSVPEVDLDVVRRDGVVRLGEGRYETLVYVGDVDGVPALTFTASWEPSRVELRKPSGRYLGMMSSGLRESHGWTDEQIHAYLVELPGIRGMWDSEELRAVSHLARDSGAE